MTNAELIKGMWVVCLPGFKKGDGQFIKNGGLGYKENILLQINHFERPSRGHIDNESDIVFFENNRSGIRARALRPATEWEIKNQIVNTNTGIYELY